MRDFIAGLIQSIRYFFEDWSDQRADVNRIIKAAKIQRVFKREQELIYGNLSASDREVCGHPGRCAVGALLVAVGVLDVDLDFRGGVSNGELAILHEQYGLDPVHIGGLIGANDNFNNDEAERKGICLDLPLNTARACYLTHFAGKLV